MELGSWAHSDMTNNYTFFNESFTLDPNSHGTYEVCTRHALAP